MLISKEEMDKICEEHYSYILKFCRSRLKSKEDAEDVAQETFLLLAEKAHIIEDRHLKAWLSSVAAKKIISMQAKRKKELERFTTFEEEMQGLEERATTLQSTIATEYAEKFINTAYSRLTDKEKILFDLVSDGMKKEGEIAEELGIADHACYMRKNRLIAKVKENIRELLFY